MFNSLIEVLYTFVRAGAVRFNIYQHSHLLSCEAVSRLYFSYFYALSLLSTHHSVVQILQDFVSLHGSLMVDIDQDNIL